MSAHHPLNAVTHGTPSATEHMPARLTAKEKQILQWCLHGKTSWEIARIQNCAVSTVNFHFTNIRRKFAVHSRTAALYKAIETGVITVASNNAGGTHEHG
jgi:DNA-binding CsgD family transcriptional regulator